MKTEKFQQFKTSDTLSVLASVLLVSYVIVYIVGTNLENKDDQVAQLEMENISNQLLVGGLKSLPTQNPSDSFNDRKIASIGGVGNANQALTESQFNLSNFIGVEGKIGKDPWGQPFHYRIVTSEKNKSVHIVIISAGPNGSLETKVENIKSGPNGEVLGTASLGDDLGFVKEVSK